MRSYYEITTSRHFQASVAKECSLLTFVYISLIRTGIQIKIIQIWKEKYQMRLCSVIGWQLSALTKR